MDLLIENARLVSMERGEAGYLPTPPARVGIQAGKIAAISAHPVGRDTPQIEALLSPQHYSQTIDLQGQLLTPGLIDCHTHLIYAGNRANEFEMRLNGVPYQEIAKQGGGILSSVKATRAATEEQLIELALPRLDGLLASGVTSVEVKSGYGLTLKDELKMLRAAKALEQERNVKITTTLLAAHALPPEFEVAQTITSNMFVRKSSQSSQRKTWPPVWMCFVSLSVLIWSKPKKYLRQRNYMAYT